MPLRRMKVTKRAGGRWVKVVRVRRRERRERIRIVVCVRRADLACERVSWCVRGEESEMR